MTWQRTRTQTFSLATDRLWPVLSDLARWPEWNRAVASVELDGPVERGTTGTWAPAGRWAGELHARLADRFRLLEVDSPRHLVLEQRLRGAVMRVEWTVRTLADARCELRQRVTVRGAFGTAVAVAAATALDAEWETACARLSRMVRSRPSDRLLKVVVAGGSGTLGRALCADLTSRGHDVVVLTRRPDPTLPFRQVEWDGVHVGPWAAELAEPSRTAVVNLAGRLVDARPTPENVRALRDSRVLPTRALVEASRALDAPLARWVQGSTTAIWSDAGEHRVTETTPVPRGLPQMTGVAQPWEAATDGANAAHLVTVRTSIVLQDGSPALGRLVRLTRAGLGGKVGSGRQWFSWIHVVDWLTVVRAALGLEPDVAVPDGVVVGAAPHPVRNDELMRLLRHHLGRPPAPATPGLLVRLGSLALRTDPALGLTGRHCTSRVLADAGFEFEHPTLDDALADLLG